jgi:8-oxo-dGTP pyrophosphatase MutT (NUDIX family)
MKAHHKVIVFIARKKGNSYEWLARRNAPSPEHGGDRWYVVTGNVDAGELPEHAAKREVAEETGINKITKLVELPIVNTYESDKYAGAKFTEYGFLCLADFAGKVKLNEESTAAEWLTLNDFIAKIWWDDDKAKLQKILHEAITKVS